MTIFESYPIHRCVFRDDRKALLELLKDNEMKKRINEKDHHGNSPIHLALMLDRRDCIIALLNNGCDVITRNTYNWNPLDEALMLGDIDIIEKIILMKYRDYIKGFAVSGGKLEQWNEVLPNVHMKIKFKCKSQVPMISKICPKDTIHFYKKGNFFRLDTTIAGFDTRGIPRAIKGNMSVIAKFKIDGMCNIVVLDHKKKTYQELYPEMPQWLINNLLMSNVDIKTLYKVFVDTSNFIIKQKKGGLLKKTKKTLQMEGGKSYKSDLYKARDFKLIIRKRTNETTIGDRKSDIRTKIINVEQSRNKTMKRDSGGLIFTESELVSNKLMNIEKSFMIDSASSHKENFKGNIFKNKGKYSKEEDDDDSDDDSDDESIASMNDNNTKTSSSRQSFSNEPRVTESVFQKYLDESIVDYKDIDIYVSKNINDMILRGKDNDGNVITERDMLYLKQMYPGYIEYLMIEFIDEFKNICDEDKASSDVNKNGKTVNYEVTDGIEDTLNWDEAYERHEKAAKTAANIEKARKEKEWEEKVARLKDFDWENSKVNEEQYFNEVNADILHMGRIMSIDEERKSFNNAIKLWMSQEHTFPVCLDQFQPLIDYVSLMFFDQVNKTDEEDHFDRDEYRYGIQCIQKMIHSNKKFPLKIIVPILATVKAQLRVTDCSINPDDIPDDLFNIPKNYKYDQIYFMNVK
ncbi:hypothetical protein BCR36DRAFT_342903 [Piromyces finnis]|uniref:Ankyrin repeat domain-containing protein n=1 Tax=Piromyces finnis TaxID=1754191 RepID=A0A1Y1VL32_9FUNG|nr:hypothetical protein BCR36DRAFT_342903 [Piromyces finnis]|eukprot:ORX59132.1 hypothetical protein BCR36DRAFT_342903 [Piromyces finnis]